MKLFNINFFKKKYTKTDKKNQSKKYDTYFGANLQAGDDHGVCFIYPFVIYYSLGVFYNSKMSCRSTKIIFFLCKIHTPRKKIHML